MRAGVVGAVGMALPAVFFTQAPELWQSITLLSAAMFFASFPMPASTAAMQVLSPNQVRAQISALFLLTSNLVGLGAGTTLVAVLTDRYFKSPQLVGSSMSVVIGIAVVLTVALLGRGCRYFRESARTETVAESILLDQTEIGNPAIDPSVRGVRIH